MSGYSLSRVLRHSRRLCTRANSSAPHVCIVGSGPAGFYTAQQILKGHKHAVVDIYERLPVPFGLVRFGVSPDHPDVKNVENTFSQTASNPRCRFYGNVNVGVDVSVDDLRHAYNAVVLAYGASEDRKLLIPGEDLNNVISARSFVGWYNGLPENNNLCPDLEKTDTAVVIGHGNVAVDVARILLTPVRLLMATDIVDQALAALDRSRIRRVYLVGRRGPVQAAFTIKEFRELTKLPETHCILDPGDFRGLEDYLSSAARPRKRLTELMMKTAAEAGDVHTDHQADDGRRRLLLRFLRSPTEMLATDDGTSVKGVKFTVNKLEGPINEHQKAIATNQVEVIESGLVLKSVGYRGLPLADDSLPFDNKRGVLLHHNGKVNDTTGVYCSGWVKTGPVGVILTTMNDSFAVGKTVLEDIGEDRLGGVKPGHALVKESLTKRGVRVITWSDWKKIDAAEVKIATGTNKPRRKFTSVEDMLGAAS